MPKAKCELVGLYNKHSFEGVRFPKTNESFVVYGLEGFTESGIHSFIRVMPALGLAMSRSNLPLDKTEKLTNVFSQIVSTLEDNKVDEIEILLLASAIRRLVQ